VLARSEACADIACSTRESSSASGRENGTRNYSEIVICNNSLLHCNYNGVVGAEKASKNAAVRIAQLFGGSAAFTSVGAIESLETEEGKAQIIDALAGEGVVEG
jgi:hypothetical protein